MKTWFKKTVNLEAEALSLTPSQVDVSGRWFAEFELHGQKLLGFVILNQMGTAIDGTWQFKLASLQPIRIRGVLFDGRLIANQFRPNTNGLGSGMIDAKLDVATGEMLGVATWYSECDRDGLNFNFRLSRFDTVSCPDSKSGEPED